MNDLRRFSASTYDRILWGMLLFLSACGFGAYFTIPQTKLMSSDFAAAKWGPAEVTRLSGADEGVRFRFSGLGESGTGLKDDYPVDTVYGQAVPSHGNGDFSAFSAFAVRFTNLDTEPVRVSLFINTGFTGVSGIPSSDLRNDTFWQSAWTELAGGESRIVSLYFDCARPWNIADNPRPHTSGTDGVATCINDFDRAEISSIGFEAAGPNGNSQAVIQVSPAWASTEGLAEYITADGTLFNTSDSGRPWFYAGTNNYYIGIDNGSRAVVDELIADMHKMNLNVLRLWGFNDDPGKTTRLQGPNAGDYIEAHFHMLDYVLHQAGLNGIRVIIPLVNYWDDYGGMQQYMDWCGGGTRDDFYADAAAQAHFRRFTAYFANRVNSVNGRIYKEDPTILAWQLANEPRYKKYDAGSDKTELTDWIHETADYLQHELAVHQLVTIGMEGFYGSGTENAAKGGKAAFQWEQTDYIGQHADPLIDLAGFHIYQDHWGLTDEQCTRWIAHHIRDARRNPALGKPVIMDEFGRNTTTAERNFSYTQYLQTAYREMVNGVNFWILYHDAYPDYDGFGVYYPDDTETVRIITTYADKIALLNMTGVHQLLSFDNDLEDLPCIQSSGALIHAIQQVASPSWSVTGDGSLGIDCTFEPGDRAMFGADLTDSVTGSAGIDVADYGYNCLIARIMAADDTDSATGALEVRLYNRTSPERTYACGPATPINSLNCWHEVSWPVETAGDLSDLQQIGIEVSAGDAFSGILYVDFIGGDIGSLRDNLLPKIDLDTSGTVDSADLYLFAECWLSPNPESPGDINDDGVVNLADLSAFSEAWQYPE